MIVTPTRLEGYQLLHNGILAFARAERQGIRVDTEYCIKKKRHLTRKIEMLKSEFTESNFYKHWKHIYKDKANMDSDTQLAHILYDIKKIKPTKFTAKGRGSTDEEALVQLGLPEIATRIQIGKLQKIRDVYLDAFLREQVDGFLHPFFNLHTAVTFRSSCVAKGTKILAVRDFLKYPDGVSIEKIKKGDLVYCFDDNLKPTIQKVTWAGKTGHREVIRLHWQGGPGPAARSSP